MKYSSSKDINVMVHQYVKRQWVYRRGKKHGLLFPPGCKLFVVVPGSPSDSRATSNFELEVKRLARRMLEG